MATADVANSDVVADVGRPTAAPGDDRDFHNPATRSAKTYSKILDSHSKSSCRPIAFVIMRPKPDAPLVPVATKARRDDDDQAMRISRTIVQRAIDEKKAILSADASSDARFNMAQSIADFHIRSLICAPMIDSNGEAFGVIQVDTRDQRSRFTDFDLQIIAGVASQAAIALDNARMHENAIKQRALQRDLEVAREMQTALLPSAAPNVPGFHFFQHCREKSAATTTTTCCCRMTGSPPSWATWRARACRPRF
jgi:hypothetical protein